MNRKMIDNEIDKLRKSDFTGKQELIQELERIEEIEYGTKELIHGVLIGIIIGFFLAMLLLS